MTATPKRTSQPQTPRPRRRGRGLYSSAIVGDRVVCCTEGHTAAEAITEAHSKGWAGKGDNARGGANEIRAVVSAAIGEGRDPTAEELERLLH